MATSTFSDAPHKPEAQARGSAASDIPSRALRGPLGRPRPRDFEIFRLAEILGLTHAEIALTSVKLTRRRISQIIARVRRWLSLHPCDDPRLASELQRKQLARHVERMHLENIMTKARDELVYGKKELTTTREKDDGTKIITTRQQPFNVQVLKVYLKSVEALAKLQQQPDVNLPPPEECEFPWLEGAINEVYDKWSDKIWSGTLKPKAIAEMIDEIVAATLQAAATQQRAREGLDTQARSASEGTGSQEVLGTEIPLPLGEGAGGTPAGEGVSTPARSASEGEPRCRSNDATDSTSTEYSVPSTCASNAPNASHTSLADAPLSTLDSTIAVATSASPGNTSAAAPAPQSPATEALPSPKNEKREAPSTARPLPLSPLPCPPLPPPCPPPPPPSAAAATRRIVFL